MGGQRSMALLIEHLDRRVVEPLAICPGPGELTDHLTALDCPVVHIPLHPIKLRTLPRVWDACRRIRALVSERAIDILAPDAPRDALTCGLAKLGTPAKLVWFVRLTGPDRLDPLLERLADGFIGDSDATRRRFSDSQRVTARYRTIVGGADLRRFRPPDDRAALRRELGVPADRFVLAFVGQVTRAKGIFEILDALGQLSAPRPLLLVVGTPHPPGITGEIEATGAGERRVGRRAAARPAGGRPTLDAGGRRAGERLVPRHGGHVPGTVRSDGVRRRTGRDRHSGKPRRRHTRHRCARPGALRQTPWLTRWPRCAPTRSDSRHCAPRGCGEQPQRSTSGCTPAAWRRSIRNCSPCGAGGET